MKERPILFNGDMVRAILNGTKTQTRRIMKPQMEVVDVEGLFSSLAYPIKGNKKLLYPNAKQSIIDLCPQGKKMDRLWVRETFTANEFMECKYRADGTIPSHWTPSIHMPRWASRITLEITNVRVERLQDISESDAAAEGFDIPAAEDQGWKFTARYNFKFTWDRIYKNWNQNPWVWVIEFKKIPEAA